MPSSGFRLVKAGRERSHLSVNLVATAVPWRVTTAMPSSLVCHGTAVDTCHGKPVATVRLALCLAVNTMSR